MTGINLQSSKNEVIHLVSYLEGNPRATLFQCLHHSVPFSSLQINCRNDGNVLLLVEDLAVLYVGFDDLLQLR
jgi:hypothetical protein